MNVHLDFVHLEYFLQVHNRWYVQAGSSISNFNAMIFILYMAMKNDKPFETLDLSIYSLDSLESFNFTDFVEGFEQVVLKTAQDKGQAYELFGKACSWFKEEILSKSSDA